MTQRRTPSGQGPTRRPGSSARSAGRLGGVPRGGTGRVTAREFTVRGEPRRAPAQARAGDPTRGGNRPAAARRTTAGGPGGTAKRTTAPQPRRLTGRATVLLVILVALALAYTYPVRVYLTQQSDIARMQAAQAEQRSRIAGLREEVAKWQDPEYVRIQARSRFYFVRPGETPLIPVWAQPEQVRDADPAAGRAPAPPEPWYDTLWSSIRAADQEQTR